MEKRLKDAEEQARIEKEKQKKEAEEQTRLEEEQKQKEAEAQARLEEDNLSINQAVEQLKTVEIGGMDRTLIRRMSKEMESMVDSTRVEPTEDTREFFAGLG